VKIINRCCHHFHFPVVLTCFLSCLLLLSGCAAKVAPIFFPEPPAPPRIQLLTTFNNQESLRNNAALRLLLGEELDGQFSKAFGLTFHNGQLFVADAGKASNGLGIVDFEKQTIEVLSGQLVKPICVEVDTDGTIYVGDIGEGQAPRIVVFDANHNYLRSLTFSDEQMITPLSIAIADEKLYVISARKKQIDVINKHTGAWLESLGQDANLGIPVHVELTPEGNLLITETGAQSLRLISPDNKELNRIGSPGDRVGNFARPKATAVDRDGNIYAVDVAFQNIQIFDSEGRILMYFGTATDQARTLVMPSGIALTYDRMDIFQKYADPGFTLEYVIAVASQGAPPNIGSKITLYGFGKMAGFDYTVPTETPAE